MWTAHYQATAMSKVKINFKNNLCFHLCVGKGVLPAAVDGNYDVFLTVVMYLCEYDQYSFWCQTCETWCSMLLAAILMFGFHCHCSTPGLTSLTPLALQSLSSSLWPGDLSQHDPSSFSIKKWTGKICCLCQLWGSIFIPWFISVHISWSIQFNLKLFIWCIKMKVFFKYCFCNSMPKHLSVTDFHLINILCKGRFLF